MPDSHDARPILIPPLVHRKQALEVVHDRPRVRRAVEHPHCDEHFLFTPHCAACLEAERTGYATATATPVEQPAPKAQKAKPKSSRSFGFTDSIPGSLTNEPTLAEQLARMARYDAECEIVSALVNALLP